MSGPGNWFAAVPIALVAAAAAPAGATVYLSIEPGHCVLLEPE